MTQVTGSLQPCLDLNGVLPPGFALAQLAGADICRMNQHMGTFSVSLIFCFSDSYINQPLKKPAVFIRLGNAFFISQIRA